MSIFAFEMMTKKKLSFSGACLGVSHCLGVAINLIVKEEDYWLLPLEMQEKSIGLKLFIRKCNYKTLLRGYYYIDLDSGNLEKFAKCMAKYLNTEVGIGDYVHDIELATGRVIIIYPDGTRQFGVEFSHDGKFRVELLPPEGF